MSDHKKKKKKKKKKKISITYQQGNLSGVLPAFMHHFGWWDIIASFITKP